VSSQFTWTAEAPVGEQKRKTYARENAKHPRGFSTVRPKKVSNEPRRGSGGATIFVRKTCEKAESFNIKEYSAGW
jgi:hypothetical protein